MEAIPKEVIDMAEDFFLHLNDREKKNIIDQFIKEQPHLWGYFKYMMKLNKSKKVEANCEIVYMMIYRCYKYYGIPLSPLTTEFISLKTNELIKLSGNNGTGGDTVKEVVDRIIKIYNQDHILDLVYSKIINDNGVDVHYENMEDMATAYLTLIAIAYTLEAEMKKHIGNEIN